MSSNLIGVAHNSPFLSFFFRDALKPCIFLPFFGLVATIWMREELVRRVSQTGETHDVFCKATFFPLQTTARESNARNYSRKWAKMKP
jgi:hypothetical protein